MYRKLMCSVSLAFCIVCSVSISLPQGATTLTVAVHDPQGAAVAEARVNVYPRGASTAIQGQPAEPGSYRALLPAGGSYVVQVEAEGFRNVSKVVSIREGQSAAEDVGLEIAGVNSTVLVTAADAAQTVDQITKAITVIDSKEIVDRGEYSIPSVVATAPGIQIRNGGGIGQFTQIRTRGLRPDATAVLIDGMRFRDTASPQTDATAFASNLNFISSDRVEVLRGSGSSLYGTNAAGGVINIVTDPGGSPTHGMIQAEGGSLGFARGRAQIGGASLRNHLKYSAGLLHLNLTRGIDGNDRARTTGGQGLVHYDFSAKTYLSGRFFASDDFVQLNTGPGTSGVPSANLPSTGIIEAIPLAPDQVQHLLNRQPIRYGNATFVPAYDDPDNRRSSRYSSTALKFQHLFSSAASFQASYQNLYTVRYYDNGPNGVGPFQPTVRNYGKYAGKSDTADIRTNLRIALWNQFTAGYEFERAGYDDLLDNYLAGPARLRTQTSIRQNAHATYFQDQLSLLDNRLQLSLSGRAQIFRLDRPIFTATGVSTKYDSLQLTPPPRALTGDASLSYFIPELGTKFRAHVGDAYRSPGLYERFGGGFYNDVSSNRVVFTPYGDPFLAPDRYNSFDGGVDQYFLNQQVRISATYFYTRVVSVTGFDSTPSRFVNDSYGRSFGYINGSGGISRGIELSAESRPTRDLTISGSYTYANAVTDLALTVPGFFRVLNVPRQTFSFVATERVGRRLTLTADVVGNGEYFYPFFAATRTAAFRFPGFTKTDLSGSFAMRQTDTYTMKAYTRIENIFNRKVYEAGYLDAGTTAVTGLSYQF
jgi:vitamin B12 transporter